MSKDDFSKFNDLSEEAFDRREWLALEFARNWAASGGAPVEGPNSDEFRTQYSEEEQGRILKLIRIQDFANHVVNTIRG